MHRPSLLTLVFVACLLGPAAPALAVEVRADYNGDGRDDLAIGVPDEGVAGRASAGAVNVVYGSPTGLDASAAPGSRLFHQNTPGVPNSAETGDGFGFALAAGDFNGDSFDDLAIGVPHENIAETVDAGAVNVIYGSSAGLGASAGPGAQFFDQATARAGGVEAGDRFGRALESHDFDASSHFDLAIGVPGEGLAGKEDAGVVDVVYGSGSGLDPAVFVQALSQDSPGVPGAAEPGDSFGRALTVGEFSVDPPGTGAPPTEEDLAVGAPGEGVAGTVDAGAVNVIYASGLQQRGLDPTGIGATGGAQFFSQATAGVPGAAERGDHFGLALAGGDFNLDQGVPPGQEQQLDDLAIGAPDENVGGRVDAGAVNVIYGSSGGLASSAGPGAQQFHGGAPNVGAVESGDRFGLALESGEFDGTPFDDLAIGVPDEDGGRKVDAGFVAVIYGSGLGGLDPAVEAELLSQDQGGGSRAESGDRFGRSLASGVFSGDPDRDESLAIGVPEENVAGTVDAGAANVIYGSGLPHSGLDPGGGAGTPRGAQLLHQNVPGLPGEVERGDRFGFSL